MHDVVLPSSSSSSSGSNRGDNKLKQQLAGSGDMEDYEIV